MPESKKQLILKSFVIFLFFVFIATAYYFFVLLPEQSRRDTISHYEQNEESQNKEPRIYPEPEEAPPLPQYQGASIGIINEDKTVSGIYPEATKAKLKNELLEIESSLRGGDPAKQSLDNWLRAGVIKKFFGDYLGARDLWEYASLIRPQNSTSFANLGGLYALYLKDFSKAEFNYKKAIENSPGDIYLYTSLADLYQAFKAKPSNGEGLALSDEGFKLVIATIQLGLASSADNTTLLSYLARFYKEQGNIPKALEYYQKVLKLDPNNQAIKLEIEAFK